VAFDLLYHSGRCLMREPLVRRREVLADVCEKLDVTEVEFSSAVIGAGTALYQAAVAGGHEGVMAKQLTSAYRPGKNSMGKVWRPASSPRTPLVAQQIRILFFGATQRVRLAGGTGLSLEDQFPVE
jgi:hypothetical protein